MNLAGGPGPGPECQLPLFDEPDPGIMTSPYPALDRRLRGTTFFDWPARTVLNPPSATGMGFWSLNPYIGCEFGCSYCYARDTHRYQMERAAAKLGTEAAGTTPDVETDPADDPTFPPLPAWQAFERRILVKSGAAATLARTLGSSAAAGPGRPGRPGGLGGRPLVIGTATDPYQPAERTFRLTRQILEALLHHRGYTIGIITKSALVTRDIPLLQQLNQRHDLSVNISLISADARLVRRLERRSPVPRARLRALANLAAAGLNAGLMIAPILPGLTDDRPGLEALMGAARDAGARFALGIPLRLDPVSRRRFWPLLQQEFPQLVERYRRCYGPRSYARRAYHSALLRRVRLLQRQYGFPVQGDSRGGRHRSSRAATPVSRSAAAAGAAQVALL